MTKKNKNKNKNKKEKRHRGENDSNRPANVPRLDPRERILSRFYEPLILLCVLGKTRGEHQSAHLPSGTNIENWPLHYVRRLFLCEAAFLCDSEKGGDTVTAIALQRTPQGRTLWVAANSCPKKAIVPFLQALLSQLSRISKDHSCQDEVTDQITKDCIRFARLRIRAYADFVCRGIEKMEESFQEERLNIPKCKCLLLLCRFVCWNLDGCRSTVTSLARQTPDSKTFAY